MLLSFCLLWARPVTAQLIEPGQRTLTVAGPLAAQTTSSRNQVTLEASPTWAGSVTYARRMHDSDFLLGLGGGFAWELNEHSFDREVWNVVHLEGFARYEAAPWFHGDLGLSAAFTSPGDDTAEQRSFFGLYAAAMAGYGVIFVGPQARLGFLGSKIGWIGNLAIRIALPFGS